MTIFGESKLGRIGYAILLVLIFCFDFAKDPIERFIMTQHDQAARELKAPRPVSDAAVGAKRPAGNGKNMPLMFPGQEKALNDLVASGRKPTPEDMEKLRAATAAGAMNMILGGGASVDRRAADLAARRSMFETLHFISVIAMTAVTVIGLLYMVSSRIRHIGWPQYVMLVPLAPSSSRNSWRSRFPTLRSKGSRYSSTPCSWFWRLFRETARALPIATRWEPERLYLPSASRGSSAGSARNSYRSSPSQPNTLRPPHSGEFLNSPATISLRSGPVT